ncbi:hypothetical protein A1351_22240 [Methylosinus sp. R-45379]|nr:hypothetical protein A1351_22240 [Methylosinus sp. R-45379]
MIILPRLAWIRAIWQGWEEMVDVQTPTKKGLSESINACIENANKLVNDSDCLDYCDPPSLRLYILLIAQEELAKAFILLLVRDDIIHFNRFLLRAMNDHACKHLVGLIMDYIIMHWETLEELRESVARDFELGDQLPEEIESAIMLLRFEKIGRWESRAWDWQEPPPYERGAKNVAEGKTDRRKQDALYVRIGGDGRVCLSPVFARKEVEEEKRRVHDFRYLVENLFGGGVSSDRYEKTISCIRSMFTHRI